MFDLAFNQIISIGFGFTQVRELPIEDAASEPVNVLIWVLVAFIALIVLFLGIHDRLTVSDMDYMLPARVLIS